LKLESIIKNLNKFAPPILARDWDNVGLNIGDKSQDISNILITLTVDEKAVRHAIDRNVDLIISHHPLIFKPVTAITEDNPGQRLIRDLIRKEISVFVMHTNLDIIPGGVNDALAEYIGMEPGSLKVLSQTAYDALFKLVVYVPEKYLEIVTKAVFQAGAGYIGNYSECSFMLKGEGTFKPEENSNPFIGERGKRELVPEVRFESIVKEPDIDKVVSAMIKVHPYEEVAYDVIPLHQKGTRYGLGRWGKISVPVAMTDLASRINATVKGYKKNDMVDAVALCGGSGADLITKVSKLGLNIYVTADINYHDEILAESLGISLLDMGHYQSEIHVLPKIERYLKTIYDNKVNIEIY